MLTADDVLTARFSSTAYRPGYDPDDVDAFLDEVARTLRERGTRPPGRRDVGIADVDAFRPRRRTFLPGYDIDEVDAFLAEVRTALTAPVADAPFVPLPRAPTSGAAAATLPTQVADRGASARDVVLSLLVGAPRQGPPRATTPPRAPRVRVPRVHVDASGVTWHPGGRREGRIAAEDVAEVVELHLHYPRNSRQVVHHLVVDRDGVCRLRVHDWFYRNNRAMWAPLAPRVRVTSGIPGYPGLDVRAKDARRTWPEAYSIGHAYPMAVTWGLIAAVLGTGAVLDSLGIG